MPYDLKSPATAGGGRLSWPGRLGLALFLFLVAGEFGYLGILRALQGSPDLLTVYLASGAWERGLNPYDHSTLAQIWLQTGLASAEPFNPATFPSLYPPSTFLMLAPLSFFPWPAARGLWLLLSCLGLTGAIEALMRYAQIPWRDWRFLLLVGGVMSLAPVQAALGMGQLALLAVALGVASWYLGSRGRLWPAGVALGVSLGLKFSSVLFIWVYFVLRRQWRLVFLSSAVALALLALGVVRLGWENLSWVTSLQENWQTAAVGINDPTAQNASRHQLLSLTFLMHALTRTPDFANALSLAVVALMALFLWRLFPPPDDSVRDLALVSLLGVLALLPVYHRAYDAAILVLPLTLALLLHLDGQKGLSRLVMGPIIPFFLFPGPGAFLVLMQRGLLSASLEQCWWFQVLVLPYRVWSLLALATVLLYLMTRLRFGLAKGQGEG